VCWKPRSSCWSFHLLREEFLSAPIHSPPLWFVVSVLQARVGQQAAWSGMNAHPELIGGGVLAGGGADEWPRQGRGGAAASARIPVRGGVELGLLGGGRSSIRT
jgi:hypothetical protein